MLMCHCGKEMINIGETVTYVGYISPKGHNHNDNCRVRKYQCKYKHEKIISKRNKCSDRGLNRDCTWKGKETCGCHEGKKVDEWPD